jgi:hypothetical protein
MRQKISFENYIETMAGLEILAVITLSDEIEICFDNDTQLHLYNNSFWRIMDKDEVIASSMDLYVRCRFENVSWADTFPPMVQKKVETLEYYDEDKATEYLEEHIDGMISTLKDSLEGKKVQDVVVSEAGDLSVILSDGMRIQSFSSFPVTHEEIAFDLLK